MSVAAIDATRLTGAAPRAQTYLAMCSQQGGRTVYSIRVPLSDLDVILPLPDPIKADPDNRKISVAHAKDFGGYITGNPRWVAPAMLIRDSGGCHFEPLDGAQGAVGYLTVPWNRGGHAILRTIDGQHRIYGVHHEMGRLSQRISDIDRDLGRTKSEHRIAKLNKERAELTEQLERFQHEFIGVDIYVERDVTLSQQMFVDVADNAKGISAAVRSRFDSSKVANRTLDFVMKHALLKDRVDLDQDRMTRNNTNFLGAKHVAALTHGVIFGIGGRTSPKREGQLNDEIVIERTTAFLDVITEAFGDLMAIAENALSPSELRERSLLGSSGMLRVLAATYRKLTEKHVEDADIITFFRQLDPHMAAPVLETSIWRTDPKVNQSFENGAYAPVMRQQNLTWIVDGLLSWYDRRPDALRA